MIWFEHRQHTMPWGWTCRCYRVRCLRASKMPWGPWKCTRRAAVRAWLQTVWKWAKEG